jgi:SAM-dependent methyltransferase
MSRPDRADIHVPQTRLGMFDLVPATASSLLDVGCNVGELLAECRRARPRMRLAGVDISEAAVTRARQAIPCGDIQIASACELPYPSEYFDCVTCLEVLEHIPAETRGTALREIRRVLRPAGRLILEVPHAGAFSWLDPQNFRFRFPRLYTAVVGRGGRDAVYENGHRLVWHHHFSLAELLSLCGSEWKPVAMKRGGLFLVPLSDAARWPFYRTGRTESRLYRALAAISNFDSAIDYGVASYDITLALQRS